MPADSVMSLCIGLATVVVVVAYPVSRCRRGAGVAAALVAAVSSALYTLTARDPEY